MITLFLVIIVILISLFLKISKKKLYVMWTILLILLMGFNYKNADYNNYRINFQNINNVSINYFDGLLFQIIMKFFYNLKFPFEMFYIITTIFTLTTISTIVYKKTTKTSNYVTAMLFYFLTIFFIDAVTVAHILAFSIFFIGYTCYPNKKKYAFYIVISSLIHPIFIFFLVILLFDLFKYKYFNKIIFLTTSILFIMIITGILEYIVIDVLDINQMYPYFSERPRYGFILTIFVQILLHITILILSIKNREVESFKLLKFSKLLLIIMPLFIINGTFMRLNRAMILPFIVVLSNQKKSKIKNFLVFFWATTLFFQHTYKYFDETVYSIMKYNYLNFTEEKNEKEKKNERNYISRWKWN